MTDGARACLALFACATCWFAILSSMRKTNPMFKSFIDSKLGRTLIAVALGAIGPAMPALIMGDVLTFRVALSSAAGSLVAAVALHFKSSADAATVDE